MSDNPLKSHMRHEKVFVKLPSGGHFYTDEDINLTSVTDEIGIKSMTAADEQSLSTPDALINGESISSVIRSCCDGVKNPLALTTADVDIILIGIKLASYGEFVDATINCPNCEEELEYKISLANLLANLDYTDSEYPISLNKELTVYLKPNTFMSIIKLSLKSIEAANILKKFTEEEKGDLEKSIKYTREFKKIAQLNADILLDGILRIDITSIEGITSVTDQDNIAEWLMDLDKNTVKMIQDKLTEINQIGFNKMMDFKCEHCDHEWSDPIDLNPVTFFTEGF